ncbi:FAD-dependent monooxygenase [Actinoplanes sp. NPDC049596]|uniref:FAD-dependent monooxygenase n=1 Tax=unclassified Actinoplanes TaxID=2626549 RepID=UPI0034424A1D
MTRARKHVAIVGAGIGGLAAAVALARRGVAAEVYEQAPDLRELGVGVHLAANGSRILQRWGLGQPVGAVAVRPEALEVRDALDGRVLVRQPMGAAWAADLGAPYYTVNRSDLHRVLAAQLPPGRLHLCRRLAGFRNRPDRVTLTFADGGTVEAAVLVAADGAHSRVRREVAGHERAVFSGKSAFRGLVPTAAVPGLSPGEMYVWTGGDKRLLCYPVASGRFFTFVGIVPDRRWQTESWTTPGDPDELRAAFAGWTGEVTAILAAVSETRRWALYDREPLDRWGGGRYTLLGDAAHPMLPHHGQGVSQALEDAEALAHFLALGGDWVRALRRYEELRRPHTAQVQLGSRESGTLRLRAAAMAASPAAAGAREHPSGAMSAMVDDVSWVQRHDIGHELVEAEL